MRVCQIGLKVAGWLGAAALASCSPGAFTSPQSSPAKGSFAIADRAPEVKSDASVPFALTPSGIIPPRSKQSLVGFIDDEVLAKAAYTIAVSDDSNDVVDVYDEQGTKAAVLTGFNVPEGLATDSIGRLYVSDTDNSRILIYAPKLHGKPVVLMDTGNYPSDVAVDEHGNIAVANIAAVSGGNPSVAFYDKNGNPGKILTNEAFARIFFCAFDHAGNLILDGQDAKGAFVAGAVFAKSPDAIEPLTISNSVRWGGGIVVDSKDHVLISDQEGGAIYTYSDPTQKRGYLSAISSTPLTSSFDPITFAITGDDAGLWDADAYRGTTNHFAYPAGGSPDKTIAIKGQPIGVVIFSASASRVK